MPRHQMITYVQFSDVQKVGKDALTVYLFHNITKEDNWLSLIDIII